MADLDFLAGIRGTDLPQPFGPSAEEVEKGMEAVQFTKHVVLKNHNVRIFDLHRAADRKAYEKLMLVLCLGVQTQTHKLWASERVLVRQPDNSERWMCCLEWSEFNLDKKPVVPVGVDPER